MTRMLPTPSPPEDEDEGEGDDPPVGHAYFDVTLNPYKHITGATINRNRTLYMFVL